MLYVSLIALLGAIMSGIGGFAGYYGEQSSLLEGAFFIFIGIFLVSLFTSLVQTPQSPSKRFRDF